MNSRTAAVEDALTMEHKGFLEGRLTIPFVLWDLGYVPLVLTCWSVHILGFTTCSYENSLKHRLELKIRTPVYGKSEN